MSEEKGSNNRPGPGSNGWHAFTENIEHSSERKAVSPPITSNRVTTSKSSIPVAVEVSQQVRHCSFSFLHLNRRKSYYIKGKVIAFSFTLLYFFGARLYYYDFFILKCRIVLMYLIRVALNFVMVEYIVSASREAWTVGSYSGNTRARAHTKV